MQFLREIKEIFEEKKDEIKGWAVIAIASLCLIGVFWIFDNVL